MVLVTNNNNNNNNKTLDCDSNQALHHLLRLHTCFTKKNVNKMYVLFLNLTSGTFSREVVKDRTRFLKQQLGP